MKTLILLLILPFTIQAQSLICSFKIIKKDTVMEDTLTLLTVHNLTRDSRYTVPAYKTYIYLDQKCEYLLTFAREECLDRQVYVKLIDIPTIKNYDTRIDIKMEDKSSLINRCIGTVWYDKTFDIVRTKLN